MSSTTPQATQNARTFVIEQGSHYHPGWDASGSSYDPITGAITQDGAQRIKEAAKKQEQHFLKVMEQVQKLASPDRAWEKFDIRNGHNWQEVVDTASQAREAYYDRAKGIKGLFKKVGMKIGEANPALDPVLQTLPCGDYTSIVCGGVILIFKAFARMEHVRAKVMDMLDRTPWLLEQVEVFIKLYPNNVRLGDKVDQLYTALLRAIIASIQWFSHGIWDRIKVLALQGLYGQDIVACGNLVQECAKNLREQAALCDKEKTVEIYELLIDNTTHIMELKAQASRYENRAKQRHNEVMFAGFRLSEQLASIQATVQNQQKAVKSDERDGTLNSILRLLSNQESNKDTVLQWLADARAEKERERLRAEAAEKEAIHLQGQLMATRLELQRTPSPTSGLTCDEVQQLLWGCGRSPEAQIERHARLDVDEAFLAATVSSFKFQRWFTSRDSMILFVTTDGSVPATAGSGLTAAFTALCKQLPEATTIAYFCGNQAETPAHDSVAAMLGNLILQLLPSRDSDLRSWCDKLPSYEHHRQLGLKNLGYLKNFFRYLVLPRRQGGQREAGAIFCLIDNFAALEQEASWESVWDVISYLKYNLMAANATWPVVLKILIMRPDRRGDILYRADEDEILSIGNPAATAVGSSARRELEFQLERARRME